MFPAILLVLMALAGCLAVAGTALRQQSLPGRPALLGIQAAIAWWLACAAMELATDAAPQRIFWSELAWPGIIATVLLWYQFARSYTRGERGGSAAVFVAIGAASALGGAVTLTNDWHGMFYSSIEVIGDGPALRYGHGPLYYVMAGLIYAAMLRSVALIATAMQTAPRAHRRHFLGILSCAALPWAADISYTVFGLHLFDFDPTSFSFAALSVMVMWLIRRRQLFDAAPLARDALVDLIPDALAVVDANGVVLEVNSAAEQFMGNRDQLCGKSAASIPVLTHVLDIVGRPARPSTTEIEFEGRSLEIRSSPVTAGYLSRGTMFLLRDVTEQRMLERRLQEQAVRDPLTGLYNRRFAAQLEDELLFDAEANGVPVSAVMIDLDHFKRLNDLHGHAAGDAVLRAFGQMLLEMLHPGDYGIRFGGEELLALLPGADEAEATARVEDLRRRWNSAASRHGSEALPSTFSAGIAAYPQNAGSFAELIKRADDALYQAKQRGRDCVWPSSRSHRREPLEIRRIA